VTAPLGATLGAISFAVKTWSLSEEVKVALAGIVGLCGGGGAGRRLTVMGGEGIRWNPPAWLATRVMSGAHPAAVFFDPTHPESRRNCGGSGFPTVRRRSVRPMCRKRMGEQRHEVGVNPVRGNEKSLSEGTGVQAFRTARAISFGPFL